jgi:hypothetical protein
VTSSRFLDVEMPDVCANGSVLCVIDGQGDPYTYRLVPFPGGGYTES